MVQKKIKKNNISPVMKIYNNNINIDNWNILSYLSSNIVNTNANKLYIKTLNMYLCIIV